MFCLHFLSFWTLKLMSCYVTKTNVNLNPFNADNNFFSSFLIADSVPLRCSSGLKKKFNIIRTWKIFKSTFSFCYFHIFFNSKTFQFFIVSLYEGSVGFLPVPTCKTWAFLKVCQRADNFSCLKHQHIKKCLRYILYWNY